MVRKGFRYCTVNPADWWKGFNASAAASSVSMDWRNGFSDSCEVERQLNRKVALGRKPYDPKLCVNCFEPMPASRRSSALTCCNACRQIAEGVRGLRRWVQNPSNVLDMDEIHQRQRFVCCASSKDGYNTEARKITLELRNFVFNRSAYHCELCGRANGNSSESSLTIQHVQGNSNDPSNLKAYCRQCNNIEALPFWTPLQVSGYKTEQLAKMNSSQARKGPVESESRSQYREPRIEILMREIMLRVQASTPLLPCDDPDAWAPQVLTFQAKRRAFCKIE